MPLKLEMTFLTTQTLLAKKKKKV